MQKAAAAAAAGKRIHEVVLPKLFKWYKDDFGFSKQEILVSVRSLGFGLWVYTLGWRVQVLQGRLWLRQA
jgi:hypothetical protein